MTLEEFIHLFDGTRLPIAFDHFKASQNLPYLVYIVTANDNFPADNSMYYTHPVIQLELYTELKDAEIESVVEGILNTVPFFYTKDEGYLTDERMYMVTYQFSL